MTSRNVLLLFLLLLMPVSCLSAGNDNDYKAEFASKVFLNSLLTLNSSMPPFKDQGRILSSAANAASLALQSLEANPSPKALYVLAELNMFNLDGALSEEQNCAVLRKGNKLLNIIKTLNPDSLNSQCKKKIKKYGVNNENICANADIINRRIREQVSAITKKVSCDN